MIVSQSIFVGLGDAALLHVMIRPRHPRVIGRYGVYIYLSTRPCPTISSLNYAAEMEKRELNVGVVGAGIGGKRSSHQIMQRKN
jgi:hypothetical protein